MSNDGKVHEIDDVQCGICGELFGQITSTHLKSHGITMAEYAILFPELPIISLSSERKRTEKLIGREFSDEHKLNISKTHPDMSGENNPMFGKRHTDATRILISENMPDMSGENHPKGMLGKHHSEKTKQQMRDSSQRLSGENNPMFGKHHTDEARRLISVATSGENNPRFGVNHTEECILRMSEAKVGKYVGKDNPNWQGGISYGAYCYKFNDSFRKMIRNRFGRRCFLCGMREEENGRRLDVHHVNYDKDCLCNSQCEFVPLCMKCHSKTNGKYIRRYWEDLIMCHLYPDRITMVDL